MESTTVYLAIFHLQYVYVCHADKKGFYFSHSLPRVMIYRLIELLTVTDDSCLVHMQNLIQWMNSIH